MLRFFMHKTLPSVLLVALAFLPLTTARAQLTGETFVEEVTTPRKLDYLLSLPRGYEAESEKKWPLIVFLHGDRGAR